MTTIDYTKITQQILSDAISIGLVHRLSTAADLIFACPTIAQYCAAYFWYKSSPFEVKELYRDEAQLAKPNGGRLNHQSLFSCFLAYFNSEYKLSLWQHVENVIPLFDEYESLPNHLLNNEGPLWFSSYHSIEQQTIIGDKVERWVNPDGSTTKLLSAVQFEAGQMNENVTKAKNIELNSCSFKISPEEFFHYCPNSIQLLSFIMCNLLIGILSGMEQLRCGRRNSSYWTI